MTATPRPRGIRQRTPSPSELLRAAADEVPPRELAARAAALADVAAAVAGAAGVREIGEAALGQGLRMLDAVAGTLVWRGGPGEVEVVHAVGVPTPERGRRRLSDALPECAAARSGDAVFASSREEIARLWPALVTTCDDAGASAWAAAPLIVDGAPAGALAAGFTTGRADAQAERALLGALAQVCAPALARARVAERERDRREAAEATVERLRALQALTAALAAANARADVARVLLEDGITAVGARWGVLGWKVPRALHVADHAATPVSLRGADLPLGAPLSLTLTARTGKAVWMRTRDEIRALYPRLLDRFSPSAPDAACTLPVASDGARLGALGFAFDRPQRFDETQRAFLTAVADACGQALRCATAREGGRAAGAR